MQRNRLYEIVEEENDDRRIAHAFQKSDLPIEILGDLRQIAERVRTPLAVRSSSLLEDKKDRPFAGIYATKMIPNNETSADERFTKLNQAVKFVYASTYFKSAKDYMSATKYNLTEEKMGVIIQKVVGRDFNNRFYPVFSGVARSYNFYPAGKAKPEEGVVNLALGLGKTIVDGGLNWIYSPASPKSGPPFADPSDILKNTQTRFWAVNMNRLRQYDPLNEDEYLINSDITQAEYDNNLSKIASTFSSDSGRLRLGTFDTGPRILNFAPLLHLNEFKFNDLVKHLLRISEEALGNPVEIEFAANIDKLKNSLSFGFLQLRAMSVSNRIVDINEAELEASKLLLLSDRTLGNGIIDTIEDIIFVNPDRYDKKFNMLIAEEIEKLNRELLSSDRGYLLIGFGRWGSSDPWLGIPVNWGQISGVKAIVEATLPEMNVEMSQGSHFFHNLTSFQVPYLSIHHESTSNIDWNWLFSREKINSMKFTDHIRLESPVTIKVDGRNSKGVILK
jgi:hypothetical protein